VNLKSVLWWLAAAFVTWWVIQNPHAAAQVVQNTGHFLASAVHGLSNFYASL